MVEADPGRRTAMGQPLGRRAVRRVLLHDHGISRPSCVGGRDLSDDHRDQGAARTLRTARQLRGCRDRGPLLAFRRSRLGVHLRVLLFVVRGGLMADVPEHGRIATAPAADAHGHSHHPISVYLKVWGYLFVLSAMSYMVDSFYLQGVLRGSLIRSEARSVGKEGG